MFQTTAGNQSRAQSPTKVEEVKDEGLNKVDAKNIKINRYCTDQVTIQEVSDVLECTQNINLGPEPQFGKNNISYNQPSVSGPGTN
jgi:hypothetical protein